MLEGIIKFLFMDVKEIIKYKVKEEDSLLKIKKEVDRAESMRNYFHNYNTDPLHLKHLDS